MTVNPSLSTMPSCFYVDPVVYQTDKEQVFYRTWQYVGMFACRPSPVRS